MTDTKDTPTFSIFDLVETDTNAEEDGRWFTDIFGDGSNVDVKLRSLTSKTSMKVRRNLDKGYRKHMKGGAYSDDIATKILVEQLAYGVIVDWRGILDRDKKPIPFTPEGASALLTQLRRFMEILTQMAGTLDNFRIEAREETAKN